jgi:signal peptidase II
VAIADQAAKAAAHYFLSGIRMLEVIGSFFYLGYTENSGAGFGILQGYNSAAMWLTIIFIGAVIYYYDRLPNDKNVIVFTALMLGGAVGNLIDRVLIGAVRDFIAFTFWPSFNIADMALTVGAIGLLIYLWKEK